MAPWAKCLIHHIPDPAPGRVHGTEVPILSRLLEWLLYDHTACIALTPWSDMDKGFSSSALHTSFQNGQVRQMANKRHLEILREGHLSWHKWRKRNPYILPNLRGADCHGLLFNNFNFSYTDFQSSCLLGANLSNSRFSGCDFRSANLVDTNFRSSDLRDTGFIRANLSNADLSNCRLHRAVFRDARLNGSIFIKAQLYETVFVRCDLSSCIGLDAVDHQGPSVLDAGTILRDPLIFCCTLERDIAI